MYLLIMMLQLSELREEPQEEKDDDFDPFREVGECSWLFGGSGAKQSGLDDVEAVE
jgi:hypothetical protein